VDEIQMIGDPERGHPWPRYAPPPLPPPPPPPPPPSFNPPSLVLRFALLPLSSALLGLRAKEIHLCGGPEARDVVTRLCQATGDELEVRRFPPSLSPSSLSALIISLPPFSPPNPPNLLPLSSGITSA